MEVKPLISRMGGKRILQQWLYQRMPRRVKAYVEPFGGSFRMLFGKPWRDKIEIINDIDADIVHFYRMVREDPNKIVDMINSIPMHEAIIIGFRQDLKNRKLDGLERAAAFYIVARSSFNASVTGDYGSYASSVHVPLMTQVKRHEVLQVAERLMGVDIRSTDFSRVLKMACKNVPGGLFVYMDPPYDQTAGYSGVSGEHTFGFDKHIMLSEYCELIDKLGQKFIQTNSSTDRLRELYGSYKRLDGSPRFFIHERKVLYTMAGTSDDRREEVEFIISNYDLEEFSKESQVGQRGLFK